MIVMVINGNLPSGYDCYSSPWLSHGRMALIEIDGLPNFKMGGFSIELLVITRW